MSLKVGIIGFGGAGMAQYQHFLSLACEVRAIYDPKPMGTGRAKTVAPGCFITEDLKEFLASGIEAVAVCSPDRTHADYVVAAIEAGLHVVCEKPLADSVEGCRRILNAEAGADGFVGAVQHQMRFLPVHLGMKRIVKSGRLGRISYIEGYYVHNLTERASRYDDWRFTDNATPLVYSGCHFVDLLRWLLEDEVEEVTGMANNISFPEYPESDLNVILLRFRSGAIGKVVVAFGAGRPQDHSVRIYGTEASIENNMLFSKTGEYQVFERPHLLEQRPGSGSRKLFSFRDNGYQERIQRYRTYWGARLLEGMMKYKGLDGEYSISSYPMRLYPHDMAVRASLENFVGAIRKENPLECSLRDAARTVAVCLAGVEAYRTGRMVRVADYWPSELAEPRQAISYAV